MMNNWRGKKVTPETALKRMIKQALGYQGWFVWPVIQSIGSYPGAPDLIAHKGGVTLNIETKAPKGKQSPAQLEFERQITEHGCVYIVCRSYEDIEANDAFKRAK